MSETTTRLQQAVEYGRAGIKVFPVRWNPGGEDHKAPMRGYAWRISATSDPGDIATDFTLAEMDWGIEGVAIAWATGEDGKVVIDLDRKEIPAWTQAFEWCAAINETGKGWHFICDFPVEFEPGNGTANLPDRNGVDVRGKGGYIVVAAPDRPGLDISEISKCQPFPRADWLVPYGGQIDALDMDELRAFRDRNNRSTMPNAINGIKTRLEHFDARRAEGIIESRHNKAIDVMVMGGEDAIRGLYPFQDVIKLVHAWWLTVTTDEPSRHGREWRNIVGWAAGRAQVNVGPPAEASDEDESLDLLSDDGITLVNWHEFFTKERLDPEWLVEGLWPFGRHISIGSKAGQGKSELIQYVVSRLALGIDPWSGQERDPLRVIYLDMEMAEEDLYQRMTDFGYSVEHAQALQSNLLYAVLPVIPALNSQRGLGFVERLCDRYQPDVFIIDTFMKTLAGDENDAATVQEFTRLTGMLLKSRQIASGRADHYGKDPDKGNRGTSAKDDDVDVAWRLVRPQGSYTSKLTATKRRQGFVPERLSIERYHTAERGVYFIPQDSVIANVPDEGEHDLIAVMDLLDIPLAWGRDRIRRRMIEGGYEPGDNSILAEAIRLRKVRGPRLRVVEDDAE